MKLRDGTKWNYSYYPIIFENEKALLDVQTKLNTNQIFPRRYFYPSLNLLKFVQSVEMPISESIASRILCLPLSHQIDENILNQICNIVDTNA
jgi:dTDP-4-amino-4,6-dideoxygalactose transaminase